MQICASVANPATAARETTSSRVGVRQTMAAGMARTTVTSSDSQATIAVVDSVSVMVITLPFIFPMSQTLGIDPIWFSVLLIKLVEIAAITPPIGLNLYAVLTAAGSEVTARQIFIGVLPFVLLEFVFLALLLSVPEIATWLPAQMRG